MNERIKELLNDATCGLEPDLSPQRTITLNEMEKFAELIVEDCINTVLSFRTKMDASTDNIVVALKERFK